MEFEHQDRRTRHRAPSRERAPDDSSAKQSIEPRRHCERSEAIHRAEKKEWTASRSLSSGAHSRDPLARNDDS